MVVALGGHAGNALAQRVVEPFKGAALRQLGQPGATLLCRAERASSTGYYPTQSGHELTAVFEKQSKAGAWRIRLGGQAAEVSSGDPATTAEYITIRQDATSVILIRIGQGMLGGTVEALTVDPTNGSFVATDAGVGPLWNRSTVWVGYCH